MIKTSVDDSKMYAVIENDIRNQHTDVVDLIRVQNQFIKSECKRLIFEFTDCGYLDAAVSVIIGTLPEYSKELQKSVKYRFVEQSKHPVFSFMKKVGMYKYYTNDSIDYTGDDVIPFNHIKDDDMMNEYASKIMKLAPIRMQSEAQDILASYIIEIYQNGFYHSDSKIGVFTSGYWDKQNGAFTFSIYDMGIGIPQKIRKHLGRDDLNSEQCVRIAFIDGFTTCEENEVNRGLGLVRLERFIHLNKGSMTMYTDDICCVIDDNDEDKQFVKMDVPIQGTLIIINIVADENHIYIVEEGNKYGED